MALPLYRGFSTALSDSINTETYGIELVKRDLLNHFNTSLGERLMRPDFGSIIPDLLFDLLDPNTQSRIEADAKRIVNQDPRVEMYDLDVVVDYNEGSITVKILLYYVEYNMTDWFSVTFEGE